MEKSRQTAGSVQQNASPARAAVAQPKWGSEPMVTIDGATFVLQPVEDLTKTMSPERVEQFIKNYKAAENPANRFDEKQAMERFRQRRAGR
jgi:hypothetical protein